MTLSHGLAVGFPRATPVTAALEFACYGALAAARFAPRAATLADQFRRATVTVTKASALCNPVDVKGESPGAETDENHLVAYAVTQSVPPRFAGVNAMRVADQFGIHEVDAVVPDRLLVPSAKSRTAPPPPLSAAGVDHFVCYTVKASDGAPPFMRVNGVHLVDQFGTRQVDLAKPSRLCNPVNVNGQGLGAEGHAVHLMCYETQGSGGSPSFTAVSPLFVNNQFGPQELRATAPSELCVPALKAP